MFFKPGEIFHAQKWPKLNINLYSQSKEDEHDMQLVSDTAM